ncbi:MAG: 30S ribosomal protein S20 [Sandaracinus sp.]
MANVASAQKRIRQTLKRTARNKHVRTSVRTVMKNVREAVAGKDKKAAQTALATAIQKIDQAVSKGVYPKKTGSRYVSRLSAHVAALR